MVEFCSTPHVQPAGTVNVKNVMITVTDARHGQKSSWVEIPTAQNRANSPWMRKVVVPRARSRCGKVFYPCSPVAYCVQRMKCDETRPSCKNCVHRRVVCPGYVQALKWSNKHERPNRKTSPNGNRSFQTTSTSTSFEAGTVEFCAGSSLTPQTEHHDHVRNQERGEDALDMWSLHSYASDATFCVPGSPTRVLLERLPDPQNHLEYPAEELKQATQTGIALIDSTAQYLQFMPEAMDSQSKPHQSDEDCSHLSIVPKNAAHIVIQPSFVLGNGDRVVQRLVSHYFNVICRALSCFDSGNNPIRADIPAASNETAHLHSCMLGIAATHMANFDESMGVAALDYQGRTIRNLQRQIDELPKSVLFASADSKSFKAATMRKSRLHILLTTILLGVTAVSRDCPTPSTCLKGSLILSRTGTICLQIALSTYEAHGYCSKNG